MLLLWWLWLLLLLALGHGCCVCAPGGGSWVVPCCVCRAGGSSRPAGGRAEQQRVWCASIHNLGDTRTTTDMKGGQLTPFFVGQQKRDMCVMRRSQHA
jgi:hypothetical protein